MVKIITREISKLLMFTIAWAIPILLAKLFINTNFLWLFLLSIILTAAIFSHFEDLAKIEGPIIFDDIEDENHDYDE